MNRYSSESTPILDRDETVRRIVEKSNGNARVLDEWPGRPHGFGDFSHSPYGEFIQLDSDSPEEMNAAVDTLVGRAAGRIDDAANKGTPLEISNASTFLKESAKQVFLMFDAKPIAAEVVAQ